MELKLGKKREKKTKEIMMNWEKCKKMSEEDKK